MLSELSGTIINRSEVGRTLNISESAVRDYLDIAQGTFLWRNLPSLEKTVSKSMVKMPRGYIRDSGLLHHLARVRQKEQLFTRPGTGAAFEGFVIEEIIQGLHAVEQAPWTFNFYRTRGGAEVDLVLTSPTGDRIPVEIKFGVRTKLGDLRSLARFIAQENCPYGILINNADQIQMLTDKIIQLPAGCI
jgi:predicted AAA+ superfamily ATPase